ncbi:MFS transporter, partial [Actinotignum timonense]|nr:MFS transporter [Actinotignum timonense]
RRTLLDGIELEDGPIAVDSFRVVDTYGDITTVEIVVHEGRNRLVRRMMDEVGFPVRELVRTAFGPIHLDRLQPGTTR